MPSGRHAVEVGMHQAEEAAQQALTREQVADEVADVAALDVLGLQLRGGQPMAHHLGEGVGHLHALAESS